MAYVKALSKGGPDAGKALCALASNAGPLTRADANLAFRAVNQAIGTSWTQRA